MRHIPPDSGTRTCTVAYVIDNLDFGGAQRQLSLLTAAMPTPYRPVVVSMSDSIDPFGLVIEASGTDVIAVTARGHVNPTRLSLIAEAIRICHADIVHGFLDAANAYAFLAGRMLGKPVVLSLRNERLRMGGVRGAALQWMLRRADGVVVNSRAGEKFLTTRVRVDARRVTLVPNCIADAALSPPRVQAADGAPVVGSIGRFTAQKRLHLLLDAFAIVRKRLPRTRLIIMGNGPEEGALRRRAERLDVGDAIEWRPPNLDIGPVLGRLHCFTIPSAYEGLPNTALEAIGAGVPVVATRAGDLTDIVIDGRTGTLLDDDRPEAIAGAITDWLTDTGRLERARTEGPALVREKYRVSSSLERLLPVYDRLHRPAGA